MNILIVGLGYAGNRFLRGLNQITKLNKLQTSLTIAYVDKKQKNSLLPFFPSVTCAITSFKPDIIIVTVNDEFHAEILNQLKNYSGFIICEKPLANVNDDLILLEQNLTNISGFCFDVIERYSDISIKLKNYITEHQLKLIRAHFYWGKDRINDYRPTCGVTSEVIHALDLIRYLNSCDENYTETNALGTCSDFSISGTHILDSVLLTAYLKKAVITGYSSFVNITRKREIDLTFISKNNKLVYASMIFDTPEWDIDYLKAWEITRAGEHKLLELQTEKNNGDDGSKTIIKLTRLVNDVILFVQNGTQPSQAFPNLKTAIQLQRLLNSIERNTRTIGPVQYVTGSSREFLNDENDLERLG